jgi:hypothetical protein
MLEDIRSRAVALAPFRYQNLGDDLVTIRELGISPENIDGVLTFLDSQGEKGDPLLYIQKPFSAKPQFVRNQTRFSDGSFPVYYGALELETARAEVEYHMRHSFGGYSPVYFCEVSCDFEGSVKELRDRIHEFPFLIANKEDGGYDRCNEVGREAVAEHLGGLLTASARRREGTCLPVFRVDALSNPRPGRYVAFSYDADTDAIAAHELRP